MMHVVLRHGISYQQNAHYVQWLLDLDSDGARSMDGSGNPRGDPQSRCHPCAPSVHIIVTILDV